VLLQAISTAAPRAKSSWP